MSESEAVSTIDDTIDSDIDDSINGSSNTNAGDSSDSSDRSDSSDDNADDTIDDNADDSIDGSTDSSADDSGDDNFSDDNSDYSNDDSGYDVSDNSSDCSSDCSSVISTDENTPGFYKVKLLNEAAKDNNAKLVRFLLEKGTDPNLRVRMDSPEFGNGQYADPEMFELVRNIRTLSNTTSGYSSSPMEIKGPRLNSNAIHPGRLHWSYYVDNSPRISYSNSVESLFLPGPTALHHAAAVGNQSIVKMLIANGAQVDAPMAGGYTPLAIAILQKHLSVAEFLISKGASVNTNFSLGKTPLYFALQTSQVDMVRLLLKNGADVGFRTIHGVTSLHVAVERKLLDVVELLLMHGANVNAIHCASLQTEKDINRYQASSSRFSFCIKFLKKMWKQLLRRNKGN